MFRSLILSLHVCVAIWCMAHNAQASCAFMDAPARGSATIEDTWAAKHVNQGNLEGCIARVKRTNGQTTLGYVHYNFICALPKGQTVTLMEERACCDTGEQGDFACGVKPRNPLALLPQLNTTLRPEKPDVRAIPQLLDELRQGGMSVISIGRRLVEYANNPITKPELQKHLTEIQAMAESIPKDADREAAVAEILIALGGNTSSENTLPLTLKILSGNAYALDDEKALDMIDSLAHHPDKGALIVPVLAGLLRNKGYEHDYLVHITQILPLYGEALQPHLGQIESELGQQAEQEGKAQTTTTQPQGKWEVVAETIPAAEQPQSLPVITPSTNITPPPPPAPKRYSYPIWQDIVCAAFTKKGDGVQMRRVLWHNYQTTKTYTCKP